MSSGLTLLGKFYSFDWIRTGKKLSDTDLSLFERRTLEFCGQWLSGQKSFNVRTSGSTGKPRSVILTREQMEHSARLTGEVFGLMPGESALICLSPDYIAGMMMQVRGMELGLEMTIVKPSGNPLDALPAESSFDFTAMVPLQLETVIRTGGAHLAMLNRMKTILAGGAPLSRRQEGLLRGIRPAVYLTFGMTETATHIALRRVNGLDVSDSFEVLPSVEIGQDRRGCLTVRSPVTNHKLIVTNDLVELESKTRFRWLARIDNVINSGGVKIHPEKVEAAIFGVLPEVANGIYADRDLFVSGFKDEKLGETVAAIIEGDAFQQNVGDELKALLAEKLDKYEIPTNLLFVDTFVRTRTGKIDRKATVRKLPAAD